MSGMDFFGHQAQARSASRRLVLLFALAVLGIIGCIYALAHLTLIVVDERDRGFDPAVFAVVALATLGIVGLAMLFKTSQLRSGGGKVARLLGGTPVPPSPTDPKLRMLRNIVEEMAIASGTPMPEVYVLESEAGINAFAAGWGTADAAVAVTRGCLDALNRDELQGVIAHEFSHVFHGDMRLNIRLIGVLFGIVCISTIGRILLRAAPRGRGDRKGGAAAFVAFGLGLVVIGSLGVLFARLIQAAISRQREYLADASAVQYTRNPRGIGMALAKIGGLTGRLRSPHAEEASHMFFADGVARLFGGAFATHPPLADRVERVLPGFQRQLRNAPSMAAAAAATPLPPGFAAANAPAPPQALPAADLVASIGNPQPMHVDAARALLRTLPPALAAAAREPAAAKALVAALLLDRDPQVRRAQLALLPADDAAFGLAVRDQLRQLENADPRLRLPLAEMSAPALRTLPAAERRALRGVLRALADADAGMSTFEWALLRILERHAHLEDGSAPRVRRRSEPLTEHAREAALVLSALAHAGAAGDPKRAAVAFARGLDAAQLPADTALLPPGQCGAAALDRAVLALDEVLPTDQRRLLHGCAEAAAADGSLDAAEVDLLRALAALWDCPIPLAP